MRLKIKTEGTYKKSKQAREELKQYGKEAKVILQWLAKQFDFKLPRGLIVKPLYSQNGIHGSYGRAVYRSGRDEGHISFNVPKLRTLKKRIVFHVIFHETIHVAEGIKHGRAGHGKNFDRMMEAIVHYKPRYYEIALNETDQCKWSYELLKVAQGEA